MKREENTEAHKVFGRKMSEKLVGNKNKYSVYQISLFMLTLYYELMKSRKMDGCRVLGTEMCWEEASGMRSAIPLRMSLSRILDGVLRGEVGLFDELPYGGSHNIHRNRKSKVFGPVPHHILIHKMQDIIRVKKWLASQAQVKINNIPNGALQGSILSLATQYIQQFQQVEILRTTPSPRHT